MFALAAAEEAYAECGDVSPSTKLSSCTPSAGSDPAQSSAAAHRQLVLTQEGL